MKLLIYCLFVSLLASCVSFQSNINGTPPDFTRILVVSKLTRTSPNYMAQYVRAFPKNYAVCTVDAGPLAFGNIDSLIRAKSKECNSEVILTLNVGQSGLISQGKYAASVNDVVLEMQTLPDHTPFWKGLTSIQSFRQDALDPRVVVRKLKEDNIISGMNSAQQ
ncbi:hypothetical protein [Fibrella forsythiae]|uniref:Lipoprotein n=1 Tax=Fibrella forsythiae TaxID=2817061 RepID=A0ABS3JJR7_9BACT|nr:hypothetical protein [Fibrella forsythiae]MBO0950243.1 hypothetical protein [Fibrella forsythiae]